MFTRPPPLPLYPVLFRAFWCFFPTLLSTINKHKFGVIINHSNASFNFQKQKIEHSRHQQNYIKTKIKQALPPHSQIFFQKHSFKHLTEYIRFDLNINKFGIILPYIYFQKVYNNRCFLIRFIF